MLLLIDRKTTAEMVLPLTTRLRSWRHNAWLVGNESRRSASRSPAQRAGGQHSTNKNLFPIRVLVTTLATTHSINQLLLLTSLQKHCVQWQHHHRCCFSLNQLNDVVPNFEKVLSPNFGRNSTVRWAVTGKLPLENSPWNGLEQSFEQHSWLVLWNWIWKYNNVHYVV